MRRITEAQVKKLKRLVNELMVESSAFNRGKLGDEIKDSIDSWTSEGEEAVMAIDAVKMELAMPGFFEGEMQEYDRPTESISTLVNRAIERKRGSQPEQSPASADNPNWSKFS